MRKRKLKQKRSNPVIASYRSRPEAHQARHKLRLGGVRSAEIMESSPSTGGGSFWLWVQDTELDKAQRILGIERTAGKNPRHRKPDVFAKHQIKIAKDTLRMHDLGARIMGGMTKDEARAILAKHGIRFKENPRRKRKGRNSSARQLAYRKLVRKFGVKGASRRWKKRKN